MSDTTRKHAPRRFERAVPSPTTPDAIEIAMETETGDRSADSPARTLLVNQNRLVRWEIWDKQTGGRSHARFRG
jgi:hypothetical protein